MDHYDVIIIGSGAGGGTLARHLAPSGKRILILERGDWLPREMQNWQSQDVFVDNRYVSEDTWYDGRGTPVPAADPLLRGRGDEALRRGPVPPAQGGFRRAAAPRRHVAGVADLVRRARAVLPEGGAALPRARRPRRGPDRARRERPVSAPGGVARAPYPGALRCPRRARPPPVPRALRDHAGRGQPGLQRRASGAPTATGSRASCTPRPTPRCSASGRRSSTTT